MTQIVPVERAIGMKFQYDLGNGRAVVIEAFIPHNDKARKDLDDTLDLVLGSLDRKKAKYELAQKAQEIAEQEGAVKGLKAKLDNLNQLFRGKTLPRQEEANKHNIEINIEMCNGRVDALKEQLADLKRLAA